jgi:hypothetical protein
VWKYSKCSLCTIEIIYNIIHVKETFIQIIVGYMVIIIIFLSHPLQIFFVFNCKQEICCHDSVMELSLSLTVNVRNT